MIELLHTDCMAYMAGARKRLADHQAQPRLFDMPRPTVEQLSLDTNTEEAEAA